MIDTLNRLATGPMVLHWTVVRQTLTLNLDVVRAGYAVQDGDVLTITDKGLAYRESFRDGSYFTF